MSDCIYHHQFPTHISSSVSYIYIINKVQYKATTVPTTKGPANYNNTSKIHQLATTTTCILIPKPYRIQKSTKEHIKTTYSLMLSCCLSMAGSVNGLIVINISSGVILLAWTHDIIVSINRLRASLRWVICPLNRAQVTKFLFNLIYNNKT